MRNDSPSIASSGLSIEQCAMLACMLEASTPKPGNVHRGADFEDTRFDHFLASAAAIGPAMRDAERTTLGDTVLTAIRDSQRLVGVNTNLGIVLLLAPLAAVPATTPLAIGVSRLLCQLSAKDATDVYEAIRLANPGGLGEADEMDVRNDPPNDLRAAMRAAEGRDMIARQYAREFVDLFETIVPWCQSAFAAHPTSLPIAVIHVHLQTMQQFPDSLIARKCGEETAGVAAARAGAVLDAGSPESEEYGRRLADLDFWLRSDGHRRNPGTTADLIAAALFVCLRDGHIPLPLPI